MPLKMQQSREQAAFIVSEIERIRRDGRACNLLIFGAGFDSEFWALTNRDGATVFLEDNIWWTDRIRKQLPNATVYVIAYRTVLGRDENYYAQPSRWPELGMTLPEDVMRVKWVC